MELNPEGQSGDCYLNKFDGSNVIKQGRRDRVVVTFLIPKTTVGNQKRDDVLIKTENCSLKV